MILYNYGGGRGVSGELLNPNCQVAKTKLSVAEKREKTARRRRENFENMSLYGGGGGGVSGELLTPNSFATNCLTPN